MLYKHTLYFFDVHIKPVHIFDSEMESSSYACNVCIIMLLLVILDRCTLHRDSFHV